MKLPFRKNKEFLSALYDILGFYPHDIEIYRIAFSHKSLGFRRDDRTSTKDRKGNPKERRERRVRGENTSKPLNNERLEYLGDAVLETVVSDILFRHFNNKREGFLTSTRSKIVQREALNRLASQMGLEGLIVAAQGTRMSHTNIGGNAFEALMGAIYLDRGYKFCHWFISNRVIGRYVDLDSVAQKEVNFKSKLLEWSQKNRINTEFKDTISDAGEKGFSTVITIEGIIMGRGNGRSKKESQQEASKEALTRMRCNAQTYDNIFRAKEKRTAMEAEESFALPKIDEIEESLNQANGGKKPLSNSDAPVLEKKRNRSYAAKVSDEAYDTAYDEADQYEVIDTQPTEETDFHLIEENGIPAPPDEDELRAADEQLRKKRTRNRGAKTVGDAVKGIQKGVSSAAEKAEKRKEEQLAEVERQRAKAERKRIAEEQKKATAKQKANEQQTVQTSETKPITTSEKPQDVSKYQASLLVNQVKEDVENRVETLQEEVTAEVEQPSTEVKETERIAKENEQTEDVVKTSEENVSTQATNVSENPTEFVVVKDVDDETQQSDELAEATMANASEPQVQENDTLEKPTESVSIAQIPKFTFDDIIFGTEHDSYAQVAEENAVPYKEKERRKHQPRRNRRASSPKDSDKQAVENRERPTKKAVENRSQAEAAADVKPSNAEKVADKIKAKHHGRHRRTYRGKRTSNEDNEA